MSTAKNVTIGMLPIDIENTQWLKDHLQMRSKGSAVSASLKLTKSLLEAIENGGKIIIEEDGKQKELKLVG